MLLDDMEWTLLRLFYTLAFGGKTVSLVVYC
jgi:hypothetical protein